MRVRSSVRIIASWLVVALATSPFALAERRHSDVEKIGNRKINGRVVGLFPNFVSLEKEIQIGAQYSQYFEQTARLVEDPVVVEYIDRLGQDIVKNSDAKVPEAFPSTAESCHRKYQSLRCRRQLAASR